MLSLFEIEIIFTIASRNYFVLAGNILKGEISKGMKIMAENELIEIHSIEFLDWIQQKKRGHQ